MEPQFEAVIYSVEKPYYSGMELPPGGLKEAEIPADINTRKETLYGYIIGAYGSEYQFPKGYENFKIVEISSFIPLGKALEFVSTAKKRLNFPENPRELSDFVDSNKAA